MLGEDLTLFELAIVEQNVNEILAEANKIDRGSTCTRV